MNENLLERFGRSRRGVRDERQQIQLMVQPQRLNTKIREYFVDATKPTDGGAWLDRPEVPTSAEVLDTDGGSSDEVAIEPNRPRGAFLSIGASNPT